MTKPKHPRPRYVQTDEKWNTIVSHIREAIPVNGVIWNWLTMERLENNLGKDEHDRGLIEGARRFACTLQEMSATKDEPETE
jgi:hypothetical protein